MDTDPTEHLIEECSELILALQKAKRFGWDSVKPSLVEPTTNLQQVLDECRDVETQIMRFRQLVIRLS